MELDLGAGKSWKIKYIFSLYVHCHRHTTLQDYLYNLCINNCQLKHVETCYPYCN